MVFAVHGTTQGFVTNIDSTAWGKQNKNELGSKFPDHMVRVTN